MSFSLRKTFQHLLIFCASVAVCQAGEMESRKHIESQVERLFEARDFAQLETLTTGFGNSGARTASGVWKLEILERGVDEIFSTYRRGPDHWDRMQEITGSWIKAYPNSPSAHLAHAALLLSKAWSLRGNGLANEVPAEAWGPFRAGTEQARLYLEKTKHIAATDPRWYSKMLTIAYRQGWEPERFNEMLNEGLTRHPRYLNIYFSALNYFSPKWGGSAELLEGFAKKSSDIARKAGEPGVYARLYWTAINSEFKSRTFRESHIDWRRMSSEMDDVLRAYPDDWNVQNFARFACLAGDKNKLKEYFGRMRTSEIDDAWRSYASYDDCRRIALVTAR